MLYTGEFINEIGSRVKVEILTGQDRTEVAISDAEGSEMYFPREDACIINSEVNDTFDVMLCQSADLSIKSKSFRPDLFAASIFDNVVNVWLDGKLIFAGYIEPQAYSQPFVDCYERIDLHCVDALSALRQVSFLDGSYQSALMLADNVSFKTVIENAVAAATTRAFIHSDVAEITWDKSKSLPGGGNILSSLEVSALIFLGDDQDSVWNWDKVLCSVLQFLNLHIMQDGADFRIFDWSTIKAGKPAWYSLNGNLRQNMYEDTLTISDSNIAGKNTNLTIGEVFNQISLTCETKDISTVVESPFEEDTLTSGFRNSDIYMREFAIKKSGPSHYTYMKWMLQGQQVDSSDAHITDYYFQVMNPTAWSIKDTVMRDRVAGPSNQFRALERLKSTATACLCKWGKVSQDPSLHDNSPKTRPSLTTELMLSVAGCVDLDSLIPCAPVMSYNSSVSGGTFSPSDDNITNYIVISGRMTLVPYSTINSSYTKAVNDWGTTREDYVPVEREDGGGYEEPEWPTDYRYTDQEGDYWAVQAFTEKKEVTPVDDQNLTFSDNYPHFFPKTEYTTRKMYEYAGQIGSWGVDTVSKVPLVACMLRIGDKVCVENPALSGQIDAFSWQTYKSREECADDDEYYSQCIYLGIDPKIDDFIIGTEFELTNNVNTSLNIDGKGTAIPIRNTDNLSGQVVFDIIGPCPAYWDDTKRIHSTLFRRGSYQSEWVNLLRDISYISISDFGMNLVSDNGNSNNTNDNVDLCYISDTGDACSNKKSIDTPIHSGVTSAEAQSLGITDKPRLSNVILNGNPLINISQGEETAKAEQLYVDAYYQEYSQPRVILRQTLLDKNDNVSPYRLYNHPALNGTFFVQGINRNLDAGTAEIITKQI